MSLRRTFIALLTVFLMALAIFAQADQFSVNESPLPAPTGMVNDYANIIDDNVQAQIEQKLRDLKATTNPQIEIAVATVKTTAERPIFDYTLAVARGWKIGDKGATNSSALLLVAVDDRKYFTQVSGGLQDELTDGIVGNLQRQYLVPAFRAGNYGKGISDTIDAYIRTIQERGDGTNVVPPTPTKGKSEGISGGRLFCCLVIFIVIIIIIIFSSAGRGGRGGGGGSGRSRWGGGGFGGTTPIIFWGGGGDSSSSSWGGSSGGDSWGGFSGGGGGFDGGGAGGDW